MASRKEQKERARQERLAAERAAAAKAARTQRLRLAGGGVVGLVAVAAAAIAIAAGNGGGSGKPVVRAAPGGVRLPAQKIANLAAAARVAGCSLIDTPDAIARSDQNRTHIAPGIHVTYATNPPSYGPHYQAPASDGEYLSKDTPALGNVVHALEHGRIEYQYRAGLPQSQVAQLEALFNEGDGPWAAKQLLLLFQNPTKMPYDVAASAWGHVIGCKTFNPAVFDALRDFRLTYTFKAPETGYPGPE